MAPATETLVQIQTASTAPGDLEVTRMRRQAEKRPRWAEDLRFWLTDGQFDHLPDSAADWRWGWREALLGKPGLKLLCLRWGHKPVPDQCMKPEHDFCAYCSKPMPAQAERRPADARR